MADLYGVTTDFLLGRSDSYMLDSKKPNVSELFISSPPFSEAEPPKEPPLSLSELINQGGFPKLNNWQPVQRA